MGYYRLIDPKATPRPIDTGEARRHRAGDHYASHLEVAVDNDFLHVVAKVWHSGKRVLPHSLLGLAAGGGESERGVDDGVRMDQVIESIEITRITRIKPSKHNCLAKIHRDAKLSHRAWTAS